MNQSDHTSNFAADNRTSSELDASAASIIHFMNAILPLFNAMESFPGMALIPIDTEFPLCRIPDGISFLVAGKKDIFAFIGEHQIAVPLYS